MADRPIFVADNTVFSACLLEYKYKQRVKGCITKWISSPFVYPTGNDLNHFRSGDIDIMKTIAEKRVGMAVNLRQNLTRTTSGQSWPKLLAKHG